MTENPGNYLTEAWLEQQLIEICHLIDPTESDPGRAALLVACLKHRLEEQRTMSRDLTKMLYDELNNKR